MSVFRKWQILAEKETLIDGTIFHKHFFIMALVSLNYFR